MMNRGEVEARFPLLLGKCSFAVLANIQNYLEKVCKQYPDAPNFAFTRIERRLQIREGNCTDPFRRLSRIDVATIMMVANELTRSDESHVKAIGYEVQRCVVAAISEDLGY